MERTVKIADILKEIADITKKEREAILSWNIDELALLTDRKVKLIEELTQIKADDLANLDEDEKSRIKSLIDGIIWNNLRLRYMVGKALYFVDEYLRVIKATLGLPYGMDDRDILTRVVRNSCDLRG
mgnify:CR=1 FL=1